MAGAPNTVSRTKDEFQALADNAIETAIATVLNSTVTNPQATAIRKVTRAQVCKMIARRALRKATQGAMHSNFGTDPIVTPGQ